MDFTPEKSFSSDYKNSRLHITAAAALSQNGSGIAMLKKTADLVKRDIPKSEDRRPYSTRHKPINSKS